MIMQDEVIVVSGLPRPGTSLMMQLLHAGGIPVVTDGIRAADVDNPRGYYEFERVKKVKTDTAWLPDARGKVVKMVSLLLFDLPPRERYRVIFMERDMDEIVMSQEKMLTRLGRPIPPRQDMARAFGKHLQKLHERMCDQPHFSVMRIGYADVVARPGACVAQINEFLGGRLNVDAAISAVDPSPHRNRKAADAVVG
jgi:hypothetical protein